MRGLDAPAFAQDRNRYRRTARNLRGIRKRQPIRRGGDGLRGGNGPGLGGGDIARDRLIPHLGVQVGTQQRLLRESFRRGGLQLIADPRN